MTLPASSDRSLGNLYFRSADRLRAAGCASSLAREGLSVVMHCEREALLDHYCDMVLAELIKVHSDVRVEAYFPESTESLMARFNEVLAKYSMQDALKPGVASAPLRVWVVHDAARIQGAEIQLLARLLHNFPGANVRALLLVPLADAKADNGSAFAAFGRRILRWDIDLPSPAQVEAAIESARYEDREMAVRQLLRLSGLLPSDGTSSTPAPASIVTVPGGVEAAPSWPTATQSFCGGHSLLMRRGAKELYRRVASTLSAHRVSIGTKISSRGLTRGDALTNVQTPPRFIWRQPSDKAQGAFAVAGALLAISTLAMYWLQPDAFASGKVPNVALTPTATSNTSAETADAAPLASTRAALDTQTGTQVPASARFGQGVSPLWRAREASTTSKLQ